MHHLSGRVRNAKHATITVESMDTSVYWEFQPQQHVKTIDGVLGVVTAVNDGPFPGSESYSVTLDNGMGGGEYTASQLSPVQAQQTTASEFHLASDDYPELGSILFDRPNIAKE